MKIEVETCCDPELLAGTAAPQNQRQINAKAPLAHMAPVTTGAMTHTTSLLTLTELAVALRVPENWLEAEAEAGRIPCLRAGKRYRFALAAVEAALVHRAASGDASVGQTLWADEAVKENKLRRTAEAERDAARDQIADLTAELETLRKTNAMFRSLIGILRDVNRELDGRNVYLEQLHGMTPGERLNAVENDAPDRCTKTEVDPIPPNWRRYTVDAVVDPGDARRRLDAWESLGSQRWGLGAAHDLHLLERRVAALEGRP